MTDVRRDSLSLSLISGSVCSAVQKWVSEVLQIFTLCNLQKLVRQKDRPEGSLAGVLCGCEMT